MTRFRTEDSRLRRLEAALAEGTISSTDETGEESRSRALYFDYAKRGGSGEYSHSRPSSGE